MRGRECRYAGGVSESVDRELRRLLGADASRRLAALVTASDDASSLNAVLEIGETHVGAMPAALRSWRPAAAGAGRTSLASGWLFVLAYEHGHVFEPGVRSRHDDGGPTATWMRFTRVREDERAAKHALHDGAGYRLGSLRSRSGRERFEASVRTALEHIAAGDAYQINLTHQLEGRFEGSARGLFADLVRRAKPWFGAYVELPGDARGAGRTIASASPEMFLTIGPGGAITTRPMKGTRASAAMAADLDQSEKERAELTMIVDLMRNDLGRVCEAGSVRVPSLRTIETHAAGTLLQATGTVRGVLRQDATLHDVLAATFPPGSITGAPKVRAMRIIDELEPVARGPYCGVIGYATDDGHAGMSVAIRTAVIEGERLSYGVGAGIVADSDPASEWQETLDKARVILEMAGGNRAGN